MKVFPNVVMPFLQVATQRAQITAKNREDLVVRPLLDTIRRPGICGAIVSVAALALWHTPVNAYGSHNRHHGHHHSGKAAHSVVKTRNGYVKGTVENGVRQFLGIPYAKPPVGELRWAVPQPAESWRGVRDATEFGNTCAQNKSLGDFADGSTSEDCLYLNVFAPVQGKKHHGKKHHGKRHHGKRHYGKKHHGNKRPVMVWIHGGGLFVGQSNGHDGSGLVREQDVVVVSINYRLNAFGFFVHPALDGDGATTNYALRDQQLALKWVQDNIERFGGDPDNVTIFGESAGGLSVVLQVISPTATGLFHKAIVESGAYQFWTPSLSLAEGEASGEAFAEAIGCPDQTAECLRSVPVETILAANPRATYANDGHTLTMGIRTAITTGNFNRVPIFNGSNHDEYRWFLAFFGELLTGHVITAAEYPAELTARFGADASAVEQAYPLGDFDSPSGALAAAIGDQSFICPARNLNLAASPYVDVYGYEFNDPNSPGIFPPVSFPYLAAHTHEIQYIFPGWKGVSQDPAPPLTSGQERLAKTMRKAWATFAKKGEPHRRWPRFREGKELMVSLEVPRLKVISDFASDHRCSLWDSLRDPNM